MSLSKIGNSVARKIVSSVVGPAERFMAMEAASGILLLTVTIIALLLANTGGRELYHHLVHLPMGFTIGGYQRLETLHFWVNDALMVIFFFVVGLEIKRELVLGELSSAKRAALPMFAALGGMVIPALIYFSFNHSPPTQHGWGIPMATDIAFAVGIMALMSRKVPFALKVFLLALAIVDDLGAVLVIAVFYSKGLQAQALAAAGVCIMLTWLLRSAHVKSFIPYVLIGLIMWWMILLSGIHATVAGVILGLMTPTFAMQGMSESPLDTLVKLLHPWVSFAIMPVFAFVNAGVELPDNLAWGEVFQNPVFLGVSLGLLVGKPIGVVLSSYLAVRLKVAELPRGVTWLMMWKLGALAGIGFTMALFISGLSLGSGSEWEVYSKLGILLGSLGSALLGLTLLALSPDQPKT